MRIRLTVEYLNWYNRQRPKEQAQIDKRLSNIEIYDHFGDHKDLGNFLFELRWVNGRRVYYSVVQISNDEVALLILGGNKNGQNSDIQKARKILKSQIES